MDAEALTWSILMPLQDSFGKKAARKAPQPARPAGRAKALSRAPSLEDLSFSLQSAQGCVRQPMMLTWRGSAHGYLLSVMSTSEGCDPTWILHIDDGKELTMLWQYMTCDPLLIHGLITEKVTEDTPAAVIPENLKLKEEPEPSQPNVFENYEITTTLGKGGMGVIYKAKEMGEGSVVALKILKADLLVDPANVERFKHEASVASSLEHPNLINVREFGFSRYGQPFITMDYLDGVELQELLSRQGRLQLPVFINIFTQICDALAYAHDKGLVHRDLKPSNIMLVQNEGGQDTVKIIDFGIAKLASTPDIARGGKIIKGAGTGTTTQGNFVGSPAYMSPEQCGGAMLDSRSDIYSLGCVMYEALSGSLPFHGGNVLKTMLAHVNEAVTPLSQLCPELNLPAELERIILRCLDKNPADRYQTARELCDDLWAFAALGSSGDDADRSCEEPDASPEEEVLTEQMPAMPELAAQPIQPPAQPAPPPMQPAPPPAQQAAPLAVRPALTRTLQQNPLSDKSFTLLRWSGILTDQLMKVVVNCEQMLDSGSISPEQAIAVIRHSFLEEHSARLDEHKKTTSG